MDLVDGKRPVQDTWFDRYRLGAALEADGKPQDALEQVEPILQANPRALNVLVLAVKCYLDLDRLDAARSALDQLKWAVSKADDDFPVRAQALELEQRVTERENAKS